MLHLVLYHSFSDTFKLSYLTKEYSTYVVTPNPEISDAFRERIKNDLFAKKIEVFTFSKLLKELLREHSIQWQENYKRKEDLLLICGTVYQKHHPASTIEEFMQIYELFSELRSYTLNYALIEELLEEYDPLFSNGIKLFWNLFEEMKIIDEQEACKLTGELSHKITAKNLVITQFSFLSAIQVDWIKQLALFHDVFILYPKDAYLKRHDCDWISWAGEANIIEIGQEVVPPQDFPLFYYAPKKLGTALRRLKQKDNLQLYLATKNLTFETVNELGLPNLFFKHTFDIFSEIIDFVYTDIKKLFWKYGEEKEYPTQKVLEILNKKLENSVIQKNPKDLKVLSLYARYLRQWQSLSRENESIVLFDWNLLKRIALLNIPRVYQIPLSGEGGEIQTLNRSSFYDQNSFNVVCFDGHYPLSFPKKKMTDKIMNKLAVIGPIVREEHFINLTISSLKELIVFGKALLLIEEGLLEKNFQFYLLLKEFVEDRKTATLKPDFIAPSKQELPHLLQEVVSLKNISSFTPTLLQSYIDCPRRFYLNYMKQWKRIPPIKYEVASMEVGTLSHRIIQDFLSVESRFDLYKFEQKVEKVVASYLVDEEKVVTTRELHTLLIELKKDCGKALELLFKLKAIDPTLKIYNEFIIDMPPFKGSIDLLFEGAFGYGLLDIKRSSFSIPSGKAFFSFSSIQLWFYIARMMSKYQKPPAFFGYLSLRGDEHSIWSVGLPDTSPLRSVFDKWKSQLSPEEFYQGMNLYLSYESGIINQLQTDTTFSIKPVDQDVCDFCPVTALCLKELKK